MGRRLEQRTRVGASGDTLWRLLVDAKSWRLWWPAVDHARTADLKPLREGSRLQATLTVGPLKGGLDGRVALLAEGRALAVEGRWLASPFRQEWFLSSRDDGVGVTSRCTVGGAAGWLLAIPVLHRQAEESSRRQLAGLKRAAERMV